MGVKNPLQRVNGIADSDGVHVCIFSAYHKLYINLCPATLHGLCHSISMSVFAVAVQLIAKDSMFVCLHGKQTVCLHCCLIVETHLCLHGDKYP